MPNSTMDDIEFEKFAVGQPVSARSNVIARRRHLYRRYQSRWTGLCLRPALTIRAWPYPETDAAAGAADGVLCVLTAKELAEAGVSPLFCRNNLESRDGTLIIKPDRPCLATDKVLFRGEAVAVIVAENLAQANAAELVELDVDVLPAVTDGGPLKTRRTTERRITGRLIGNSAIPTRPKG